MSDVPRVARSVDDLRVGMVVAWFEESDVEWKVMEVELDGGEICWDFTGTEVILSDPPARDWLVPATQMEALREALIPGRWPAWDWDRKMRDAARAVLDAAREVEHE